MVRKLTIDVTDEVYGRLQAEATATGTTPEAVVARLAESLRRPSSPGTDADQESKPKPTVVELAKLASRRAAGDKSPTGVKLSDLFGSVSCDNPRGTDNVLIDEDLARDYGRGLDDR